MRGLRAVGARAGSWGLLGLVAVVGVGAAVVASGTSAGAARSATLGPLYLVTGLVAALAATELARRRRPEVALARVRGGHGLRLVGTVVGEALSAVVLGAAAGFVVGALVIRLRHDAWGVSALVGGAELAAAVLMGAVVAVPAVGSAVVVTREPLAVAVRRSGWSGPGSRVAFLGLVLGVAVVLAAVLAAYRARGDAPGSLVLAGPALVGLAAGQLLVWLHRALSRRAVASSSLALLLGVRRSLAADHAPMLRALVALGAVVAAAACAVTAAGAWADDSARVDNGASLRLELPDTPALATYLLTRELDPEGRWLMAAAVNDQREEPGLRVAWLDLARYERVAGAHLDGTPADLGRDVAALRDAEPVRLVTGGALQVVATPGSVTLTYLDDDGIVSSVAAGPQTPVADCARGCVVLTLEASVATEVSELRLGAEDLLAGTSWVDASTGEPVGGPGAVSLPAGVPVRPAAGAAPEPVVTAGAVATGGDAAVEGIGGSPRPLLEVAHLDALPLLSGAGVLGDLPVGLAAAGGSIPAVRSVVLARADTPRDLLDALAAAGAEEPRSWAPASRALGDRALAEQRVGRVTLVTAGLLALLALLAGRHRRTLAAAREQAALRLAGVPVWSRRRAALVEAALLASVVAVGTLLAGWVAATTADGAELVRPGAVGLPFGSVVRTSWVALVAVATGGLAAAGTLLRRPTRRAAEPVTLTTEPELLW